MTTPTLSCDSPFGRLYTRPGETAPTPDTAADRVWQEVHRGNLYPSITNVIHVTAQDHLRTWAARLAAEAAVDVALNHPNDLAARPEAAAKWAAGAADRVTGAACDLGDVVHNLCEQRALGDTPNIPTEAAGHMRAWDAFVRDYQPEFVRVESTVYGATSRTGHYAGTADFIASINGILLAGDYKTGSVRDSAALQLAAIANADQILTEDSTGLTGNLPIVGGMVVRLTKGGYEVHPITTTPTAASWQAFRVYRAAWNYHAQLSSSRDPLLLQQRAGSADDLTARFPHLTQEDAA